MATAEELLSQIDAEIQAKKQPVNGADLLSQIDNEIAARSQGRPGPPATNFLEDMSVLGGEVSDFFTGDDRREFNIPELPSFFMPEYGGSQQLSLARGDLGKLDILREMVGDIPADVDSFGNVFVEIPEGLSLQGVDPGIYYLDNPGLSPRDVDDIVTTTVLEGAGAVLGLRGANALAPDSKLARIFGAGAGMGGAAVGQDLLAGAAGSDQGVDLVNAALTGVLGGAGEGVGQIAELVSRLFRRGGAIRNGTITPQGESALRSMGLSDDQIAAFGPEFIAEFQRVARKSVNADDLRNAAIQASANTLPQPVRLTRGDITRDVGQQAFEDAANKGARGRGAYETLRPFREAQNLELQANSGLIQQRLGGGTVNVANPGEGVAAVQSGLLARSQAAKSAVNDAYDAAKDAGRAAFDAEIGGQFAKGLRSEVVDEFGGGLTPGGVPQRLLDDLDGIISPAGGGQVTEVTIRALEEWRKRLNTASRSRDLAGTTDGAALSLMKNRYEGFLDQILDGALIRGDETAIDLFRNARTLARDFAEKYKDNKIVANLIEVGDDGITLARNPEEALGTIFNSSGLGGKTGAQQALEHIKTLLGDQSPEWLAMKEEAFIRLLRSQNANQMGSDGIQLFSGDRFSSSFNKAMQDNRTLMSTLFNQDELMLIDQFRRVALAATNRVPGAVNTSNSANEIMRLFMSGFGNNPASRLISSAFMKWASGPSSSVNALISTFPPPLAPPGGATLLPAIGLGGLLSGQRPAPNVREGGIDVQGLLSLPGQP
jgi:hypothetical protein